jgi:heme/copper-type cytochrome/quinol oxidase subunit 2
MDHKKLDFIYLIVVIGIIIGLPAGILSYDNYLWQKKMPSEAKVFTLTGHTERGWLMGDVHAGEILTMNAEKKYPQKPVIQVNKGDVVVFKLKSMDVVHGFSFRDAGIIISDGIQPGKVKLVSFVAEEAGTFTFSCNAICGDNHQNMQGTLVVKA